MQDNIDDDDTHLCIKCSQTIVGLSNYIQHRKQNCNRNATATITPNPQKLTAPDTTSRSPQQPSQVTPPISYEPFHFAEPEPPSASSHGGKTSKSLGENYDLPYELGADVFFSSLQLQSVQSSVGQNAASPAQTGGKTGAPSQGVVGHLQRQKSMQSDHSTHEEESWIEEKKSYDSIFKSLSFELSEEEEEDENENDNEVEIDMPDDEEEEEDDYDPVAEVPGGKWKSPLMRHSPPVVPASHTGGKWKPEHRPNLRVAHSQLSRLSPNWDDHLDDVDLNDGQHPPSDHTKGKWVPGTKMQRLEYKEVVDWAKHPSKQDYWCNICCRKLKSKAIYENHLKTSYHMKRSEPETQLEKAVIQEISQEDINRSFALQLGKIHSVTTASSLGGGKKRKRRSTYLRCSLCKHVMNRHLIGKHLISHYHYRRMQLHPGLSLHVILENIHSIVLQSPFQCRPCRFYANTEEAFLLHWNSASHLDVSEGPGRFWCSYCQYECEDNNQMRRHLLGPEHKEVLLAINRSVPICISKRLSIKCSKCGLVFRYNFELRRHIRQQHAGVEYFGSASDAYQSKFKCLNCSDILPSKIALQRHEKFKHSISKYFCSICSLEFNRPCKARRHRKTLEHKQKAGRVEKWKDLKPIKEETFKASVALEEAKEISSIEICTLPLQMTSHPDDQPSTSKESLKRLKFLQKSHQSKKTLTCIDCHQKFPTRELLKEHREKEHSLSQCIICGDKFVTAQELGRHSRKCKPQTNEVIKAASADSGGDNNQIITQIDDQGQLIRKCDLCDYSSNFQSEIIYHRIFHVISPMGSKELIKCPLCEKNFRKQSLRCHLRQHTNEKIFACDICDAKYSRPQNLKEHKDRAHSSKPKPEKTLASKIACKKNFQCHNCGKVFKSKQTLHIHCLTHHGAKPEQRFMCPHENCEYGTVNNALLKVHLASHSIESFKCSHENCNYVGKSELHLKR
uniref:C2H2-type domain-containing protein n=1 Tax=Stomoxys calcitrans TaxID=35570 RepID=A0A1I8NLS9_STOCA